ncbi:MAG: alkaline phosphatase [Mesosutterella sp.]|nr:alkaline phosphatase [Mesosutterella sp.]
MLKTVISLGVLSALSSGVMAQGLMDRPASGSDLTQPGAATRIHGDQSAAIKALISSKRPKNVILMIGDGMGYAEITGARNYALGAGGFFKGLDALPFTGSYTHYSLNKDSGTPNYVTDSAASGTAWSTGVKTYNGAIGVDIKGNPRRTLIEMAKAAGMATGDVTTSEIQDATPAVLVSHVTARKCYGPERTSKQCPKNALENGGLGSITEQLLNTRPDVTLGGGAKSFAEKAKAGKWKGKTLMEQARERGFQVVRTADKLAAVKRANQKAPLLGLFAEGNMPVRWQGPRAVEKGYAKDTPVVTCTNNAKRTRDIPNLAAMTRKAIDLLKGNPKGFFLQVEGASIDKQDHAANPCGQFGETVDLDEAVQVALEFAKKKGDTLVIVTADHAHSSQILPLDTTSPGLTQKLRTADGSVMVIGYGTAVPEGDKVDMTHTGTQVRVAAYGPQAANVTGLIDQTDVHYIIRRALRLK